MRERTSVWSRSSLSLAGSSAITIAALPIAFIVSCYLIFRMPQSLDFVPGSAAYSYRKLSTGSILAARPAGTVPKRIPITAETTIATTAESPEIGIR